MSNIAYKCNFEEARDEREREKSNPFYVSGEIVTTIPTIGFNVETVEYKNISFTVWGEFLSKI